MAASGVPFTTLEAYDLRGYHVRLLSRLGKWPAGSTGLVVDQHPYLNGCVVEVQFDGHDHQPSTNFEYFTKDDYERYLVEC